MTCELKLLAAAPNVPGTIQFTGIEATALADTTAKIQLKYKTTADGSENTETNNIDTYKHFNGSDYVSGLGTDGYCRIGYPSIYNIYSYKIQVTTSDGATVYHETDWVVNPFFGQSNAVVLGLGNRQVVSGTNVPTLSLDSANLYIPGLSESDCSGKSVGVTFTAGGTTYQLTGPVEYYDGAKLLSGNCSGSLYSSFIFCDGQTIDIVLQSGEEQYVDDPDNPGMGMPTMVYTVIWRQRVTVRVNLPPSAITLSSSTAAASATDTVEVGTLTATDANLSDTHTFAIAAQTDNATTPAAVGYFAIGGTGNNKLIAAANTPAGTYNVTIVCSDGLGTLSQAKTVTITSAASYDITGFTATATSATQITCSFVVPAGTATTATIAWQRSTVDPSSADFVSTDWDTLITTDLSGTEFTA